MLEYDKIAVSEGIDVNKTNHSEECIICHYFLQTNFRFQAKDCNNCHDF